MSMRSTAKYAKYAKFFVRCFASFRGYLKIVFFFAYLAYFAVNNSYASSNLVRAASVPAQAGRTGSGGSFAPALSADNQHVAFISYAKDLVTNDDLAEYYDVFIRDLTTSNTTLVSVNLSGVGGGNDHSITPSVSSNGNRVVFASAASNFVVNDTNNVSDIFLRDLSAGVTLLISVGPDGVTPGNSPSKNPHISDDGRFVIFESAASNLVANDTNNASDVFIRDLETGTTSLLSINASGTASANGVSELLHVTPDCRSVAFRSTATDIIPEASSGLGEIFVRDWQAGITSWATANLANTNASSPKRFQTALSANGLFLVLQDDPPAPAPLYASSGGYRHELMTGVTLRMPTNGVLNFSGPAISSDGEVLAFSGGSGYDCPGSRGCDGIYIIFWRP